MTKLTNSNYYKTQIVTKLKNSICDKTQNSDCDKTQTLKKKEEKNYDETKKLNCDKTQKLKGGATRQLSWTTNPNLRELTLFFKLHAPYFNSTSVLGYIWICMRQISPKVPLSPCFLPK